MKASVAIGDLTVHRMGFGAGRLTGPNFYGEPRDARNARRVLRRAVELGVQLVDTADAYGPEINERQIAEAFDTYPPGLVIATKGGYVRRGGGWFPDGRPEHLTAACEASLRRLRRETIDLYQLHAVDPAVPLEESVGALETLRGRGLIRHTGLSNVDAGELTRGRAVATIASVQNEYNVFARESDPVVELCAASGVAFLAYYPIDAGGLARNATLAAIAAGYGATPAQIALAWLLHRSACIVPIPGTSSLEHLEENAAAASIALDERDVARLAAL